MIYILAYHNFWQLVGKKTIVYRTAPEYVIEYLRAKGSTVIQSDTRPKDAALIMGNSKDWPTEDQLGPIPKKAQPAFDSDIPEYYDVVHYIGRSNANVYRRHKLNDYLKRKWSVATLYEGSVDLTNVKFIVISDPRGADELVNKAECPIYYDKTDSWEALTDHVDTELIEKAAVVTCSSKAIYESVECKNKYLLPNAADSYKYYPVNKHDIAVYVGKAENKIDYDYCQKLKEEHPDFKFVSIGVKIPGFEYMDFMPAKEMNKFLRKCRIGLVPLVNNAYTHGQFNLKVWNYIQNKLPVIVTDKYNYDGIKNVHIEWTTDFVEEEVPLWEDLFERMIEIWGYSKPELIVGRNFDTNEVYRIWWSISHKCNFKCPYCCQSTATDIYGVNEEEAEKVAVKINELIKTTDKSIRMSILGGEPAIYDLPKLLSIIKKDYDKEIEFSILTNFALKDAEWWSSLAEYGKIFLLASCHVSQIRSIEEWADKATKLKNINFKAKFVVDDNNFEEVKKYYFYLREKGLEVTLEGCRDSNHHPDFGEEVYDFIKKYDLPAYNMDDEDITQTEAIIRFHDKVGECDRVKCYRRLSIKGSHVISGCKLPMNEYPIYNLDKLRDQIYVCNRAVDCNLCKVNKVYRI